MTQLSFVGDCLTVVRHSKMSTVVSAAALLSSLVFTTGCKDSKSSFKNGGVKSAVSSKELATKAEIELKNPSAIEELRDVDMADLYGQALEKSTDASFEMSGYMFEGVRSFLLDNQEGIAAFTEQYPTIGALFDAAGVAEIPEFSESDFDNMSKNLYNVMNGIDQETKLLGEGREIGCEVAGAIAAETICVLTEGAACVIGGSTAGVAITHACEHKHGRQDNETDTPLGGIF